MEIMDTGEKVYIEKLPIIGNSTHGESEFLELSKALTLSLAEAQDTRQYTGELLLCLREQFREAITGIYA